MVRTHLSATRFATLNRLPLLPFLALLHAGYPTADSRPGRRLAPALAGHRASKYRPDSAVTMVYTARFAVPPRAP